MELGRLLIGEMTKMIADIIGAVLITAFIEVVIYLIVKALSK